MHLLDVCWIIYELLSVFDKMSELKGFAMSSLCFVYLEVTLVH